MSQEIAEALGLDKTQVKNWINRQDKKQASIITDLPPKHLGHARKKEMRKNTKHLRANAPDPVAVGWWGIFMHLV